MDAVPAMRGVRALGLAACASLGGLASLSLGSGCTAAAVGGAGGLAARAPAASLRYSSGGKAW